MSAPDTEPEKQAKRHRPSLLGIAVSVIVAIGLLIAFLMFVVERGGTPQGSDEQVDGRTGEVVEE